MPSIWVRTLEGRIARTAARGKLIPHDKFVEVDYTPYIDRLLNVHGDIEERSNETPKPEPVKAPVATPATK